MTMRPKNYSSLIGGQGGRWLINVFNVEILLFPIGCGQLSDMLKIGVNNGIIHHPTDRFFFYLIS